MYILGILNKETKTMKILPIALDRIIRLDSVIRTEKSFDSKASGSGAGEERVTKASETNLLFGTKEAITQDKKKDALNIADDIETQKFLDEKLEEVAVNTDEGHEYAGHVAGTVRRHKPVDIRHPLGATLHFYVGDSGGPGSKIDDNHILRKLKPKGIWHLTVLGSLATTQREYVALHTFSQLNPQMQNAILNPSPEQFPSYEEQTPAMPDCFTSSFGDHLRRSFNAPHKKKGTVLASCI